MERLGELENDQFKDFGFVEKTIDFHLRKKDFISPIFEHKTVDYYKDLIETYEKLNKNIVKK